MNFFNRVRKAVLYDVEKSPYILQTNFTRSQLLLRIVQLFIAAPISLFLWLVIKIFMLKYRISIYILPTFRPGIASMYISTIEPLCRELQHLNNFKHYTILVNPAESISNVLVESYEPNFSVYLDDRRKFARLVAYLIPQKGIEKKYLTGKREFDAGWNYRPSKNYINQASQVPADLKKLGIGPKSYAIFVHSSKSYFLKRYPENSHVIKVRSNDLSNYELPLLALIKQGLQIVRVGTHVDDLPDLLKDLSIVDLTRDKRDEISELWLYEHCKLLVSVGNGAFWFSRRFDRPTIVTDSRTFIHRYQPTFYTPSLIKDNKTNELLSFRQMQQIRAASSLIKKKSSGLDEFQIVLNSPSTLTMSINEALDFANGITHIIPTDKIITQKYSNFCQEFDLVYNKKTTQPTISFLREFSRLLD